MSFGNKVVLVTGASSGIGAATATLFAKEGASVAIVGRNQTKLQNVAANIQKLGKAPLVINADVSKDNEAVRIVKETVERFGTIDVLVNNAGFARYGGVLDGKILAAYDEMMDTNVRAVIKLTTLAAPHLVKSKGNIVNISSIAGLAVPIRPAFLPYAITKAALDSFTKGAAKELAVKGVRVNSVNPGPVKTEFLPNSGIQDFDYDAAKQTTALKRVSEASEIAELIMYLASEKARGITGSIFVTDNGRLL